MTPAPLKRSHGGRAPTTKRETIGVQECMVRLALSKKAVERAIQDGLPSERKGNVVLIYWPDARIWRDEEIRAQTIREHAKDSDSDAKERKLEAEAELAEIEVAKARGEVIPVDMASSWFSDAATRVRMKILGLIPRLAVAGVGHNTPSEALAALRPIVHEIMAELHKGDDIPIEDDTEEAA